MTKAKIDRIFKDLFLVTLVPPIEGFDDFIGVWIKKGTPSYLIDVGPTSSADQLENALKTLDVNLPDFIFLTHIHLDHAGGIGHISDLFPKTPVICHKSAIPHLEDPAKLWEGSLKTLGERAKAYGPVKPVLKSLLVDAETFSSKEVIPIITPGHAPHHVSFITKQCLFAGETCGVHLRFSSNKEYRRPATPPRFFLETSLKSLDLLIEKEPEKICFGHFGIEGNAVKYLLEHKDQLVLWKDIIKDEMKNVENKSFSDGCLNRLLKEDPKMAFFDLLDEGKKEREKGFIINSIKGFQGYLEQISDNP
jgi:glyoxylase-like metal-dependent hydrolase (beta-lactamase superfamily II)